MPQSLLITQIKDYFKKRDDVLFAFLFGSQAKGRSAKKSDWDIGVYLKPRDRQLERETEYNYPARSKIWSDLIDLLDTDNVDLVILNSSPADVAATIITGQSLVVKDRESFLEFMLATTREAEDYRQMVDDYYKIFQRSQSLTLEDRKVLQKRILFLDNELVEFNKFKTYTQQKYLEERDAKRNMERWIENIVNCSLDISKILLASEHKEPPDTYKKVFLHLQFLPHFSQDLAEMLMQWADLRNILAHEYLDLRWQQIKNFIDQSEIYWQKFLKTVKIYL